jgi:hypothetical protein
MLALGALTLAVLFVWLMPEPAVEGEAGAVGMTGIQPRDKHDEAFGEDAAVLREIETITGTNDAMALVGRRVDLHVDVQERATDRAFWVGPADNRVLVVVARDNRDGVARQTGASAHHGIEPVRNGQRAAISGVIRAVPRAEQRLSWELTDHDAREVAERKVYIRADRVSLESH